VGYRFYSATTAFVIAVMRFVFRMILELDRKLHLLFPWLMGMLLAFAA
jgi:hypothetical protein